MILNLLRVEALKVEEMIKRSFSEHATQSLLPDQEKKIAAEEERLKKFERKDCQFCGRDLEMVHQASMDFISLGGQMLRRAMMTATGRRMLSPGRVVVVHKEVYQPFTEADGRIRREYQGLLWVREERSISLSLDLRLQMMRACLVCFLIGYI